jgi:hypothetical protein
MIVISVVVAAFQVGVIYSEQFYAELFIGLCRLER